MKLPDSELRVTNIFILTMEEQQRVWRSLDHVALIYGMGRDFAPTCLCTPGFKVVVDSETRVVGVANRLIVPRVTMPRGKGGEPARGISIYLRTVEPGEGISSGVEQVDMEAVAARFAATAARGL